MNTNPRLERDVEAALYLRDAIRGLTACLAASAHQMTPDRRTHLEEMLYACQRDMLLRTCTVHALGGTVGLECASAAYVDEFIDREYARCKDDPAYHDRAGHPLTRESVQRTCQQYIDMAREALEDRLNTWGRP